MAGAPARRDRPTLPLNGHLVDLYFWRLPGSWAGLVSLAAIARRTRPPHPRLEFAGKIKNIADVWWVFSHDQGVIENLDNKQRIYQFELLSTVETFGGRKRGLASASNSWCDDGTRKFS